MSGSLISFFDIYISWSVPSSNFGLNQRYNVEYRLLVDSVNPSNVSAPVSSYKLTDATPNNNYTVIVSSVNDVGRGPLSNSFTIPSISSGESPLFHTFSFCLYAFVALLPSSHYLFLSLFFPLSLLLHSTIRVQNFKDIKFHFFIKVLNFLILRGLNFAYLHVHIH